MRLELVIAKSRQSLAEPEPTHDLQPVALAPCPPAGPE
jgi:hypothetical protein